MRYHHSSEPLEQTIVRYSTGQTNHKKLGIFTRREKAQPRLLVTSVRVRDRKVVTFDSYHRKADDPKQTLYADDGINIDHIMASGTLPVFFDFRKIGGDQFCDGGLLC